MMRLGRGLQMLRLGKRAAVDQSANNGAASTPEQVGTLSRHLLKGFRIEAGRLMMSATIFFFN